MFKGKNTQGSLLSCLWELYTNLSIVLAILSNMKNFANKAPKSGHCETE